MIRLTIGKGVYCENLPRSVRNKIHKDLTFDNPKYVSAMKSGRFIGSSIEPKIHAFAFDKNDDLYWVPRGYIYFLKHHLKQNKIPVEVIDRTLLFPKMRNVDFLGKLRDYQELAVNEMVDRYPIGVLEAGTGAGKTVCACGVIARRKQPTLVIVHNKELLYQWEGAIEKFLDRKAGLIGDGNFKISDITVGIVNSVRNKTEELSNKFGQIIVDECHRVASTVFTDALQEFSAKHYLGLSATPYRRDGLGNMIMAYIGPKLHVVDKEMLHETGAVLKPEIKRVFTNFAYNYRDDYSTMISKLCANDSRNTLISDAVCNDLEQFKDNVLIVSDRVSHCEKIADKLESRNIKCAILHGKIPAKKRSAIVDEVRSGNVQVLISTLQLIGEGFDAPNLSSIHLTSPVKFSGRLLQVIGRVLRPEEGKTARVYDYRDPNIGVLNAQGLARDKIYDVQWG